ncbi:cytochrome P450 [Gymnopilus junonius]|uniref:Cytochrome P450 n=1 Tax=Gymnopilus junonius TaxID=109634 RepID=A0A9P5NY96_GYMJU|nr:cytochrome P450 [Gymnopilus junonius]
MIHLILEAFALCVASVAVWKALRRHNANSYLDNIPGPPVKSIWKGNFPKVFNPNAWNFHQEIADKYGSVVKIKSVLGENQLYVFDPKAMHNIVVKDQYTYEETSAFIVHNKACFGPGLLGALGEQHRKQRKMLNPVFSMAHLRNMIPTFYDVTYKLKNTLVKKVMNGPQEIDMLHWMSRTALELVGQSGLGYSFDTLTEDAVLHPYSLSVKRFAPVSFHFIWARNYLLPFLSKFGSPKFQRRMIDLLPWKELHDFRDIIDVLHNTAVEIIESKKKALAEGDDAVMRQVGQGKDIISILLRANMQASEADSLSEEELLGQVSTLTFAATDTTSSALSRILFILSKHQDAQEKLRREIQESRKEQNGDLTYDQLVNLPYLDAVCRETLRLYAPVSTMSRTTRQDIILPLSKPITGLDGREMHDIFVPNNTNIIIGILASNRNPDIWGPDSLEWKPERWLEPLPKKVDEAHIPGVYSHLMTFLGGGRACIGFKFSQLEMKVVLSLLVESFRFSPSVKEISWQMNAIATPILKEDRKKTLPHSQLPLVVELVN